MKKAMKTLISKNMNFDSFVRRLRIVIFECFFCWELLSWMLVVKQNNCIVFHIRHVIKGNFKGLIYIFHCQWHSPAVSLWNRKGSRKIRFYAHITRHFPRLWIIVTMRMKLSRNHFIHKMKRSIIFLQLNALHQFCQ